MKTNKIQDTSLASCLWFNFFTISSICKP